MLGCSSPPPSSDAARFITAARCVGATHTLNAGQEKPRQAILDLTDGRGADYVFVTVGSTEAMSQGLKLLRPVGTLVMVGLRLADSPYEPSVPMSTIVTVLGVRVQFPYAGHVSRRAHDDDGKNGLPRAFWLYAVSAALVAFGFADYSLIAFHFTQTNTV